MSLLCVLTGVLTGLHRLFWLRFYELRHSIEMRPSTEGDLYSQSRAKSNNSCTPKEITPYEVYHHPEE